MQTRAGVQIRRLLRLFTGAAVIFRDRFQKPLRRSHPRYRKDPLDAALIFLEGCACKRQRAEVACPHAAVAATGRLTSISRTRNFAEKVCEPFSDLLEGRNSIAGLNPLYRERGSCHCIWCATDYRNTIMACLHASRTNRAGDRWYEIRHIRGCGRKIASFFMRDVAVQFGTFPSQDRWLLQPTGIRVRRKVCYLSGKDEDRGRTRPMADRQLRGTGTRQSGHLMLRRTGRGIGLQVSEMYL